ncbi:ParB/RepB/Spo0J family plasmid partition protein [Pantoea sp. SO10]|uniref:ParB/RepB/Spo0J family plasmid partition protein n=1 Tax=Pantoea sp. SO10 TaxID=2575375 RepID=UPI0010C9A31F|nr:ParB/RepB/Spo0J family plasmid partition protein [Pantoea sp. SO10]QCP62350.1 ParB/RepB/Spo0J family plasmid partition protein [Pantoea sp. SO10]
MKRAPIIPKSSPSSSAGAQSSAPAAPMVDSLIARVGGMAKGNSIVLPVCGRDVKFTLETVPAGQVEKNTHVWGGNERVQAFLTEDALDDLIPSFLLSGQQNPAFGRRIDGGIEVADGSRRRMTAILTSSEYRVLVGELDDEQMDSLCKLGNDYRPTSAFERGKRYAQRLENEFANNISALADAEGISRKIITRCLNTARLPSEVISLFSHPGELSARAGEQLFKAFEGKESLLAEQTASLIAGRKNGLLYESEEVIQELNSALTKGTHSVREPAVKKDFAPGATAQYKGNKVLFSLDRTKIPETLIAQFEELLTRLNR